MLTLIIQNYAIHSWGNTLGREWIGSTPNEIAPGAKPLGSAKTKFFNLVKPQASKVKKTDLTSSEDEDKDIDNEVKDPQNRNLEDSYIVPRMGTVMQRNWVGLSPHQLSPRSIPLGSMAFKHGLNYEMQQKTHSLEKPADLPPIPFNLSIFGGSRAYYTDNVMRTKEGTLESGVWENSAGTSLETVPFELGQYITLIPRLDLLMQWANYGEESVNDLLDYRFGMVKGGLNFYLPKDFLITTGLEYSFLHSQFSGDKLFDSVSPSLSIQKIHPFSDNTFLMMDILLKYSKTTRVIDFVADNIFPDDGDNIQATLNFNLIHTMGSDGQFIFMPGLGINRTEYLKNTQDGRVDLTCFAGLTFIWQVWDWLGVQAFSNYSTMRTNSLGKDLLGQSSSYQAFDTGGSLNISHSF